MKPKFKVDYLNGAWTSDDYKSLLEILDVDDIAEISDDELFEYLSMALKDLSPQEAALEVLQNRIINDLNKNQIQELSHEISTENLWEEYREMRLLEELFDNTSLLYKALNGKFPHPKAVHVGRLVLTPLNS